MPGKRNKQEAKLQKMEVQVTGLQQAHQQAIEVSSPCTFR